jgi:hypothetical protein
VSEVGQKNKSKLSENDLHNYFDEQGVARPNKGCDCLAILADAKAHASIVNFLCWFEKKLKHEQDLIVFDWFKYLSFLPKREGQSRLNLFCLPYINDGTAASSSSLHAYELYSWIEVYSDLGKKEMSINPECIDLDGCDAHPQGDW